MKKLLSMLLTLCVLVGVVCLVSTTAFATEETEIQTVDILLDELVPGQSMPVPTAPEGANYYVSGYIWSTDPPMYRDNLISSETATVCQDNQRYKLELSVRPLEGYTIPTGEKTVTFNGTEKPNHGYSHMKDNISVTNYYTTKTCVDTLELEMEMPRSGSPRSEVKFHITEQEKFYIDYSNVAFASGASTDPNPETVESGCRYTVTLALRPTEAYEFVPYNTEVLVNGQSVTLTQDYWYEIYVKFELDYSRTADAVAFPAWPETVVPGAGGMTELTVPEGANYTLQSVWMDMRTGEPVETLEAGDVYTLAYVAIPDIGFHFTEETTYTLGGEACEAMGNDQYMVIYKSYDLGAQKIDRVDITLPTLKKGCTPGAVSVPAGVNYELWEIMWGESTTDSFDDAVPVATVGFGTKVYAVPVLCAADGYIFSEDVKLYFNGEEVAVEYLYAEGPVIEIAGLYGTLTPPTADGWYEEDNTWVYYRDGSYLVSTWLMDSKGWVYLDGSGHMVKNSWAQDSTGWCYMGADGYMTYNRWAKDSTGWCYLGANGYMVYNKWIRDSIDWCYVGANGYMVTDGWAKDSTGWCYLGADGYMVRNSWAPDTTGVCRLDANGYMVKSKWVHDGNGWAYVDANGYVVFDNWVLDGGNWYAIGADGYMIANAWIEYKDNVYRLASDGRMLTSQWVYDGNEWSYVNANGRVPFGTWVADSSGTCYIGASGYMLRNEWISYNGEKYYVDNNGHKLINTTRKLRDSNMWFEFTYKFDSNGVATIVF